MSSTLENPDAVVASSEQATVINEVLQSTTGTDVEFIELFGDAGASLDGLSLISFNANADEAGDLNLQIDFGADDALGENGFLLIGTDSVATTFGVTPNISIGDNTFENDSQVFALVETDTLVVTDGTVVDDENTVVVDSVATVNGDLDIVDFFDAPQVGPNGTFLPAGVQRVTDGVDTDEASDFVATDFFLEGAGSDPLSTPVAGDFGDDTVDPGGDDVAIYTIQGAGHVSSFAGQEVTTSGIVTAVDFNGYYLQDPDGDGDDATSDAIFVFVGNGATGDIAVGDEVEVTGTVSEFVPGGAGTGNLSTTQITDSGAENSTILSSGNDLPAATIIGDAGRTPPTDVVISDSELPVDLQTDPGTFNPETDGIDFYESLEGMLVTVDNPVVIGATNRFDETYVVADDGDNVTGGSPDGGLNDRGGLTINADIDGTGDLNPERIQIQYDAFFDLLPEGFDPIDLNIGDDLSDVTGVVSYSFGNFEVLVTEAFEVEEETTNVAEVTELAGTDDELSVATYNVLNVTSAEADGDADQIALLAQQIVENLGAPDILALQEIQDNSGVANDGTLDADETLQALVDAIALAGGPDYEFVSAIVDEDGENGGVPGGNIRNAFLWNPDRVELDTVETLESDVLQDIGISDPDAFDGTRDPLLGVFTFNGQQITLINNHLSSRFGSDPIFGATQPFEQGGEAAREAQTSALNEVVDALLADDPDANIVVLGDFNTFEFTDELSEDLPGTGDEQVLTNLFDLAEGDEAYTFVFQGNSQALDHIFVSGSLFGLAEIDVVHVNVDFVENASDHEPIVATFLLDGTSDDEDLILFASRGDVVQTGAGGDDVLVGSDRADVLSGSDGDDVLTGNERGDLLNGDGGDDVAFGGVGSDTINGGTGEDRLFGERGNDVVDGGDGNDDVFGGVGRDTVLGGAGDDALDGGTGADTLDGGEGNDVITGGEGADTFEFGGGFGVDVILDFTVGVDALVFTNATLAELTFTETVNGTDVTATGTDTGTVSLDGVFGFGADDLIV
ncbi:MAG: endonuclease/exonuclease/phosphatase family protein [Pseudomonadota bacterium]